MIQAIKENFDGFLIFLGSILCTAMFFGLFLWNSHEDNKTAVEMAKLGCSQTIGVNCIKIWQCPVKDR